MPKKIDWDAIRHTFISSERDLTYGDVASMFGVSRQSVELKASPKAENWQVLREAFRLSNALKDLEPRSFEKTATVLISLMKAYCERNPPTLAELVSQTIDQCIELGYSADDLYKELTGQSREP